MGILARMQRFFVDWKLGTDFVLRDPDLHHQISRVLRMQKGDQCVFFNGNFVDETYEIGSISKSEIAFIHRSSAKKDPVEWPEISLYQALPNKLEKLEYVLQKGVEVGIDRFVFFPSERSQPLALLEKKKPRLLEIAKEALEQSGGDAFPEIRFETKMPAIPQNAFVTDTREAPSLATKLGNQPAVALFIGPEGGWSDKERDAFLSAWVQSVSLGNRILRTETAGICAAFLVRNI